MSEVGLVIDSVRSTSDLPIDISEGTIWRSKLREHVLLLNSRYICARLKSVNNPAILALSPETIDLMTSLTTKAYPSLRGCDIHHSFYKISYKTRIPTAATTTKKVSVHHISRLLPPVYEMPAELGFCVACGISIVDADDPVPTTTPSVFALIL